jgi:GNAT superfamily N-acetyltransferase
MEIRALQQGDDRSQFRSGDALLDRFFHVFAGQNQFRHHLGVTYVAIDGGLVLGFATVAPGHIEIDRLPASARKQLPRYPLPVLRLARLATDSTARGSGVGRALLRFVLDLALRMSDDFGCVGVLVDAKPDAVEFYAKHGFIPLDLTEGQSDARPQPSAMFRSIRAIRDALGPGRA